MKFQGKPFTKGLSKKGAQGSLEYLIIIAGIVIIAAAVFFLTRGFFQTEKTGAADVMDSQTCIKLIDNKVHMQGEIRLVDDYESCLSRASIKAQNNSAPFTNWAVRFGTEIYFLMCPENETGSITIKDGLSRTMYQDSIQCAYGTVIGISDLLKNQDATITSQVNLTVAFVS